MEVFIMKKFLAAALICAMTLSLASCTSSTNNSSGSDPASTSSTASTESSSTVQTTSSDLKVGVFYYAFSDVYITSVRTNMDAKLDALGVTYQNFDGNNNQAQQTDQINTAIADGYNLLVVNIVDTTSPDAAQSITDTAKNAGIPVIFFNREISDDVVKSYENCAFVGTDAAEAGHMQGEMIGNYLVENYETVDLNGDGKISYVMFKGQEANAEAEYRTQYAVEDADKILADAGKEPLSFYDSSNSKKYLVDQTGAWSAQAAVDYMNTILSEYSESNGNMIELVIANNDGMAEGAISALQGIGYNTGNEGSTTIPVFGVDAVDTAKEKIQAGQMTGTIMQDAEGMADTITTLVGNLNNGEALMANTDQFNVDESVAKIRVPYGVYTG